tara:strand:+ start:559 stop:849 length:291 start_codon:yes stop_codon:yes gene_type:complete
MPKALTLGKLILANETLMRESPDNMGIVNEVKNLISDWRTMMGTGWTNNDRKMVKRMIANDKTRNGVVLVPRSDNDDWEDEAFFDCMEFDRIRKGE